MLTVKKLIEELMKYDQNAYVVVRSRDHAYASADLRGEQADMVGRSLVEYYPEETAAGKIVNVVVFE